MAAAQEFHAHTALAQRLCEWSVAAQDADQRLEAGPFQPRRQQTQLLGRAAVIQPGNQEKDFHARSVVEEVAAGSTATWGKWRYSSLKSRP